MPSQATIRLGGAKASDSRRGARGRSDTEVGAQRRARGARRRQGRSGAGALRRWGARGRLTLGRRAGRRWAQAGAQAGVGRDRRARGARPAGRPGRGLGVQLGQWAVHLVHSACFDLV